MSEKRRRTGKVTKGQKIKLIENMKTNRRLACGHFGGTNCVKWSKDFWDGVAQALNACGGASKTGQQWKKCWSDWKHSVKKQQAALLSIASRGGNSLACERPSPLSKLDQLVLEFLPAVVVDSDTGTDESVVVKEEPLETEYLENEEALTSSELDEIELEFLSTTAADIGTATDELVVKEESFEAECMQECLADEETTISPKTRMNATRNRSFFSAYEQAKEDAAKDSKQTHNLLTELIASVNKMANAVSQQNTLNAKILKTVQSIDCSLKKKLICKVTTKGSTTR